jgi:uncharacterized protein
MLLEFAVTNFRSIKERQVMTFRASNSVEKKEHIDNLTDFSSKRYDGNMIKSAIVYGANAAGKSNFLKALMALENLVVKSDELKLDKAIPAFDPYLLDKNGSQQPTIFEIEFVAKDEKRYFYAISIEKFRVLKEELFVFPEGRKTTHKALVFSRNANESIKFGGKEFYQGKQDFALNENQLLLSKAGRDSIPSLREPYRFFTTYLFNAPAYRSDFDEVMLAKTEKLLSSSSEFTQFNKAINSIIRAADTGINRVFTQDFGEDIKELIDKMPDEERQKMIDRFKRRIKTSHTIYEDGKEIGEEIFDLSRESTGTMKLLGLAGFVVAALRDGSVVVVDELDKNLHPLLTRMIFRLFNNPELNKKNAQLIFSTHDISLIDKDLLRLDQIFIVDKNVEGTSNISRLSDYKGITKVKSLQKWYTLGMFKGIPAINDYEIDLHENAFLQ